MKIKRKLCLLVFLACIMAFPAFAKTSVKNGVVIDKQGFVYIYKNGKMQYGYVEYKGNTYYCHKTGTKKYPKGSATMGEMRIKDGKWYAFGADGVRYDKNKYIIKGKYRKKLQLHINVDHSVRYVYMHTASNRDRYSTKGQRWQKQSSSGKWVSYGKKVIPDGWVDTQR